MWKVVIWHNYIRKEVLRSEEKVDQLITSNDIQYCSYWYLKLNSPNRYRLFKSMFCTNAFSWTLNQWKSSSKYMNSICSISNIHWQCSREVCCQIQHTTADELTSISVNIYHFFWVCTIAPLWRNVVRLF